MNVEAFCKKHSLSRNDLISFLQEHGYGKFTKVQMSMICNPAYGLALDVKAVKLLKEHFEPEKTEKERERKKASRKKCQTCVYKEDC